MSKAYATKDQMKVWKSAAVLYKDDPIRSVNHVMLSVKEVKGVEQAYLIASDGYQIMKRNILVDDETPFETSSSAIPRATVEKAEKAMKQGDLAYFDDGMITLKEPVRDHNGDIYDYKTFAVMPYTEQLDLFGEFDTTLHDAVKADAPERKVLLNAKLLKLIAEQLRSDDDMVFVEVTLRGQMDIITFQAFKGDETKEITGAVMPLKP